MIQELEYITSYGTIHAHKDTMQRNAWHLSSVSGNGLPPISTLGSKTYGVAGKTYGGISIDSREIDVDLYASGWSAAGLSQMQDELERILSLSDDSLGWLRLRRSNGEWRRIRAKCVSFDETQRHRSTTRFSALFECPYAYFEEDTLHKTHLFEVAGGKVRPLERPYNFANYATSITPTGSSISNTISVENIGDVNAPCLISIRGSNLTGVEVVNNTTGASVEFTNSSGWAGIDINTDINDLYARSSNGNDALRYITLPYAISDFYLVPGINSITVNATGTLITPSMTLFDYRGRFSSCL